MRRPPNQFGRQHGMASAMRAIEAGLVHADIAAALRPHMATVYWDDVVGPQVAGATRVMSVRGGDTLVVRTKNGVWANELTLLKLDILKRLNQAIGGKVLADIRFEIGALDKPGKRPDPDDALPTLEEIASIPLPPLAGRRIAQAADAIDDPELARLVRRSLARAAQAGEWKAAHGWLPCSRCRTLAPPPAPGDTTPHLCPMCRVVKP